VNATIVVYVFYGSEIPALFYVVPHTSDTEELRRHLKACHGSVLHGACDRVIETLIEDLFGGGPNDPKMAPYVWEGEKGPSLPITPVEFIETGEM